MCAPYTRVVMQRASFPCPSKAMCCLLLLIAQLIQYEAGGKTAPGCPRRQK